MRFVRPALWAAFQAPSAYGLPLVREAYRCVASNVLAAFGGNMPPNGDLRPPNAGLRLLSSRKNRIKRKVSVLPFKNSLWEVKETAVASRFSSMLILFNYVLREQRVAVYCPYSYPGDKGKGSRWMSPRGIWTNLSLSSNPSSKTGQ
jgi:hypothetical protein